jgi:hypothetical protein
MEDFTYRNDVEFILRHVTDMYNTISDTLFYMSERPQVAKNKLGSLLVDTKKLLERYGINPITGMVDRSNGY